MIPSRLHFGFFLSGSEAGCFDDEIVMSLDTKGVSRKIKLQQHGQSTVLNTTSQIKPTE